MKLFVVVVVAVAVCFCFGRAGGQSAVELGVKLFVVVACLFLFWGGRGASQLWSCVVLFCGEWRRVSFRGAKGGESALELGVKLFVVVVAVVVLSVFVLGGGGGPVSFGVVLSCSAGNGGESASGGRRGASQLWSWV